MVILNNAESYLSTTKYGDKKELSTTTNVFGLSLLTVFEIVTMSMIRIKGLVKHSSQTNCKMMKIQRLQVGKLN